MGDGSERRPGARAGPRVEVVGPRAPRGRPAVEAEARGPGGASGTGRNGSGEAGSRVPSPVAPGPTRSAVGWGRRPPPRDPRPDGTPHRSRPLPRSPFTSSGPAPGPRLPAAHPDGSPHPVFPPPRPVIHSAFGPSAPRPAPQSPAPKRSPRLGSLGRVPRAASLTGSSRP